MDTLVMTTFVVTPSADLWRYLLTEMQISRSPARTRMLLPLGFALSQWRNGFRARSAALAFRLLGGFDRAFLGMRPFLGFAIAVATCLALLVRSWRTVVDFDRVVTCTV